MAVKCNLISIGEINRYIALIFIGSVFSTTLIIIAKKSKNFNQDNNHPIVLCVAYSLGLLLAFILFIIHKVYTKRKKENKFERFSINMQIMEHNKKEKYLWIILVSIIDFIAFVLSSIFWVRTADNLVSWEFDILFLTLVSYYMLKEKLYKHHFTCMVVIIILGTIFDLINNGSIENLKTNYLNMIILFCVQILFDLTYIIYRYMMIKKYIISFEIMFYQGIIELILSIIALIITTATGFLDNFWNYYNNLNSDAIAIFFLIVINEFLYNLSIYIIIERLSQFHVLLLQTIAELVAYIYELDVKENTLVSVFTIIIIILCMLMILIFIEIIELNCFGLSDMTKKNIEVRAKLDAIMENNEDDYETRIDYQDYIFDLKEDKNNEIIPLESKTFKNLNDE